MKNVAKQGSGTGAAVKASETAKSGTPKVTDAGQVIPPDMPLPGEAQPDLSVELRRQIAVAAYYRAEQRGFAAGSQEQDWLEAEAEVTGRERSLHSATASGSST